MKNLKQEAKYGKKGITLISLVVTIIVLIILVSVSINLLFGENGLITMAQKAKNEYEEAEKNEEQQLAGVFGKKFADYNGQLHVEGSKLLNQYNEQLQLNGLYYGYGNSEYTKELLTSLKNKGVNLIKIGYSYSGGTEPYNKEGNMDKMYSFIDQLLAMDFYIDIIYWSGNDLNQEGYSKVSEAIDYFTKIANKYPDNTQILYEICNEPFDNTWEKVKQYADSVIPEIRQISENAIISVPTNDNLFNEIFLSNLLEFENLMYVTHIYAGSSSVCQNIRSMHEAITNYNLPIFISEWSNINSSGTDYNNVLTDNLIYIINQYEIANSAWYFDESDRLQSDMTMIKYAYWEDILKTGNIYDDALGISGKYYFDFLQGINKGVKGGILIDYNLYSVINYGEKLFWKEEYRTNITKIIFEDKIKIPDNIIKTWDVSADGSESVMAYIIDDGNNTSTYELHICGDNKKVMATSLYFTFAGFSKLEYIDLNQLDTTNVKNMNSMFRDDSNLHIIVGLESISTSNVVDMSLMFGRCINLKSIQLENFDTSNVVNMSSMFRECRNLKSIQLENFDTSNVVDMSSMFHSCSNLDLLNLSSFNTTNVTNMYDMFSGTGMRSSDFKLILGEKFDTSKVTNMEEMFQLTGDANTNFSLDLTSFTFRDDLNYTNIFAFQKQAVTVYVKDEEMQQFVINARGENVWSTANVLIK